MKEFFPRKAILPSVLCLLPIGAGLLLYSRLPEQVVTHWNASGEPDGYSSRFAAVFIIPGILFLCELLVAVVLSHDPHRKNMSSALFSISLWMMPVLFVLVQGLVLATALGAQLPVASLVMVLVGVVIAVIGNYLPKCKHNYSMGIRLPWTLASEENWNRTHRLAGWLWVVCGILMAAGGILEQPFPVLLVLLLLVLVPAGYSFWLYRKGI